MLQPLSLNTKRLHKLKRNQLAWLIFLTQGTGAIAFAVFIASYALALPSNQVLHGEPLFRIPLAIFGGLFILLTVTALIISFIVKPKEQSKQT
jgi:uncharacterized membrane protein YhaH (DUF805 family)